MKISPGWRLLIVIIAIPTAIAFIGSFQWPAKTTITLRFFPRFDAGDAKASVELGFAPRRNPNLSYQGNMLSGSGQWLPILSGSVRHKTSTVSDGFLKASFRDPVLSPGAQRLDSVFVEINQLSSAFSVHVFVKPDRPCFQSAPFFVRRERCELDNHASEFRASVSSCFEDTTNLVIDTTVFPFIVPTDGWLPLLVKPPGDCDSLLELNPFTDKTTVELPFVVEDEIVHGAPLPYDAAVRHEMAVFSEDARPRPNTLCDVNHGRARHTCMDKLKAEPENDCRKRWTASIGPGQIIRLRRNEFPPARGCYLAITAVPQTGADLHLLQIKLP